MGVPYKSTISVLLRKCTELMREAGAIKERLSVIGNDVQALDRTLETLGLVEMSALEKSSEIGLILFCNGCVALRFSESL